MNHQERIEFIVNHLELRPHPEGGFYKESYRSEGSISAEELGKPLTVPVTMLRASIFC